MNYIQFKKKSLIFLTAGIALAACNNNQSSDTTSDTSTSMMSTDTVKAMPADTGNSMAGDTSAIMKDTSSKKSTSASSKKKGKAVIVMLPATKHTKFAMDKSGVYDYSETMPEYPGGESAVETYVTNSISYPDAALNDNKEGKANIAFTVDESGKVSDVHSVSNKLGDGLDDEAVRVVSEMPNWKPGTVKGKPVKVRMTLPITFQLE